jgi:enamine deaminase RidA (YjgF/YER057c/UK114 family)
LFYVLPSMRYRLSVGLYPGVPYDYAAAAGGLLFVAGACPLDAEGRVVKGGLAAQVNQALDNLLAVLDREGLPPASLVKTTIFVATGERADLVGAWRLVERRLAPARPPSTLVGVTALGYPDQLFEIEAIAGRTEPSR